MKYKLTFRKRQINSYGISDMPLFRWFICCNGTISSRCRKYSIEQRYNNTGFYYVIVHFDTKIWMSADTVNKFDTLVDAKRVFVDYLFGKDGPN